MFSEIEPQFEARVLMIAKHSVLQDINHAPPSKTVEVDILNPTYTCSISYKAAVHCLAISVIAADDIEDLRIKQENDSHFGKVINAFRFDDKANLQYPQYLLVTMVSATLKIQLEHLEFVFQNLTEFH